MGVIEQGWGLQVILWFQSWRTPLVETLAILFHYAGSEQLFMVLVPMIYWCIDASLGRRLVLFCMLSSWLNNWFKEWLHRPRPYQVSNQVNNVVEEASYGIPSNHTQSATTLWGLLALKVRCHWVTGVTVLYVLLMAASRMSLGVHFPQDVISGLVIGLVLLLFYAWLEPKLSVWLNRQSMGIQLGLLLAVAAVMALVHPVLFRPTSAEGLSLPVTYTTTFLFSGIGFILETRYVRFSTDGLPWQRSVRLIVGLVILLGLYMGLKVLFDGLEPATGFRVLRYGLLGLWASLGAPWVFVKMRLADSRARN